MDLAGEGVTSSYLSAHPQEDRDVQKKGWTDLAKYVHSIDPYGHMITIHPTRSARSTEVLDESVIDFDMLQTGHRSWLEASNMVAWLSSHRSKTPPMPVLVGELVLRRASADKLAGHPALRILDLHDERSGRTHLPSGWDLADERHDAFHTALSLGNHLRKALPERAPGSPGSTQMGIGKNLLTKYPWWRFEPHPEWVQPHGTTFEEPHADWSDPTNVRDEEKGNYLLTLRLRNPR